MQKITKMLLLAAFALLLVSCVPVSVAVPVDASESTPTPQPQIPTPVPSPTPGFVQLDETRGQVSRELLGIEGIYAEIAPEEKLVILGAGATTDPNYPAPEILLASNDVPIADKIRQTPCPVESITDSSNTLTQGFKWSPGMNWQSAGYHPGIDVVCNISNRDIELYSLSNCLVIARYYIELSESVSISYWVSGVTTVCKANVPLNLITAEVVSALNLTQDPVPMLWVVGHMRNDDGNWPIPGQVISIGTPIGIQGRTGHVIGADGRHAHYGWFIEQANGTLYAINLLSAFVYN